MAAAFHVPPLAMKAVLTSYTLSLAVFIPVSGWIADRLGARVVFCAAIAIFAAGSALCGFSTNLPMLLLMRVVQGFGGAMMTPLLLWTGWAAPTVAVGTDLVWNALTKTVGAVVHYRHKNVNLRLVWKLASGSVPGALFGLYLLKAAKWRDSIVDK